MELSKIIFSGFMAFGICGGLIFCFFYIILFSKGKLGVEFRHDLYSLVERGRRNE